MSHPVPRIPTLLLATAGFCLVASGAQAQSTGRYMTWANRPASTTPGDVAVAQAAAQITAQAARNDMIPRRIAPSQGPARPMMQAPTQTIAVSRGLTPASAWIGPRIAPTFAPGSPDPIAYAAADTAAPLYPPPVSAPAAAPVAPRAAPVERAAVDPMAPRRDAPVFNLHRPTTEAQPAPAVQPAQADPADPMAPRRDARIFQVQGDTQAVQQAAPSAQASVQTGQSGARYYSVHRDAGRQPDPTALPDPVYFDSVSMDLAEPPANEPVLRDAQGRRRVVTSEDPSLP